MHSQGSKTMPWTHLTYMTDPKKKEKKKKKNMHNALSSVGVSHFGRACVEIWGKLREGWGSRFVCDCIL